MADYGDTATWSADDMQWVNGRIDGSEPSAEAFEYVPEKMPPSTPSAGGGGWSVGSVQTA